MCISTQGPHALQIFFSRKEFVLLLHLSILRDNNFEKRLPFSRREVSGQSSLQVSAMTNVIAFFLPQSIMMIRLILQAMRSVLPSNLCSRLQQLKLKKNFFTTKENLWPITSPIFEYENFSGIFETGQNVFLIFFFTKDSITSLKPKT